MQGLIILTSTDRRNAHGFPPAPRPRRRPPLPRPPPRAPVDARGPDRRRAGRRRGPRRRHHRFPRLRAAPRHGAAEPGAVSAVRDGHALSLHAGEVLRLPSPRGLEIACDAGHLWITEEAQADDVWLGP